MLSVFIYFFYYDYVFFQGNKEDSDETIGMKMPTSLFVFLVFLFVVLVVLYQRTGMIGPATAADAGQHQASINSPVHQTSSATRDSNQSDLSHNDSKEADVIVGLLIIMIFFFFSIGIIIIFFWIGIIISVIYILYLLLWFCFSILLGLLHFEFFSIMYLLCFCFFVCYLIVNNCSEEPNTRVASELPVRSQIQELPYKKQR